MHEKKFFYQCLCFTAIITFATWCLLIWDHFHGGVPSHHLLHRKELPAISNWWSGVLIPFVSWFLLYRLQKRVLANRRARPQVSKLPLNIIYRFVVPLCYGAIISLLFTLKVAAIPGYMMLGLLLIAFFYPVYLSECMLGFIIGMTLTFGAFISIAVTFIFSICGWLIYSFLRPAILHVLFKILSPVIRKKN